MTTNEGLSILLAIFLIVVVFRWLLGSAPASSSQQQARRTGVGASDPSRVRQRAVTPEMIETVCTMFPNIPPAAIQYDLQKTGSVEVTCDNILQNGGLPLPPPAVIPTLSPSTSSAAVASSSSSSSSATNITQQSLLHRYRLHDAASKDVVPDEPPRTWESSPEKRQQHLQKRKEAMVLQARKRFMEKQKEEKPAEANAEASSPPGTSQHTAISDKLGEVENDSEQRRQQMLRAAEMRMGLSSDNTL